MSNFSMLLVITLASLLTLPVRAMLYTQEKVNEKNCDVVTWTDANGKKRSVALVKADGDVHGFKGGYIERYTYFVGDTEHTGLSWNKAQEGVSGLGCAVDHGKNYTGNKKAGNATTDFILKGENHCVWRFTGVCTPASMKPAILTIEYTISEGRNDILWTVSYDCSKLADKEISLDARGPYVQFDWDGDGKFYEGPISGIRWGDRYKFKTVTYTPWKPEEVTWDYTQPNTIPYMLLWKDAGLGDIELGMVQTQPWETQDAGGYWWFENWKKTGTGMPTDWKCPFQLNAYEKYSSEKMAWGANYGYVGQSEYDVLGNDRKACGYPYQGYAVSIILNKSSDGLVDRTISSMEAAQKTLVTASVGSVISRGTRYTNINKEDAFKPAGWNHVRATWSFIAGASGGLKANLAVSEGSLYRPVLEIGNFTGSAPATIQWNTETLNAGKDFAASVDAKEKKLYVTVFKDFTGAKNEIVFAPAK